VRGFVAGTEDGHQFVNRGARPAAYLVISNRDPQDTVYYADADVDLMWSPPHARGTMTRARRHAAECRGSAGASRRVKVTPTSLPT
jgi:uncharacterized cupin superfamily protein